MNLKHQITPKNDDGSINYKYTRIAGAIAELAGDRVASQLHKLFVQTHNLEKESATAGLQLVIALFSVPMDERYERSKFIKHIREELQEIGFKPSKVSKLMGAGRFYAEYKNWTFNSDFDVESSVAEFNDNRDRFLNVYFNSIAKLYELSRMNGRGVEQVKKEFLHCNKVYTQSELEQLVSSFPKDEYKRRGQKPTRTNFPETRPTHALATHESLAVLDDAEDESFVETPKSSQVIIQAFFQLFNTGDLQLHLDQYEPSTQTRLIEEIRSGIPLLEDFVAKNLTVDVVSTH
jgi:hypothetical protein